MNPAVTAGLLSIGAIKPKNAAGYIVAQLLGGLLAFAALRAWSGLPAPSVTMMPASVGELLGAAILAMGVATVVLKKVSADASGFAVGFSLFTGASVASMASPGVVNPAVALGIGAWNQSAPAIVVFILMPLIGGVIGAKVAKYLQK